MMIIRPIEKRDTQALLAIAKKTGSGFTSLPDNKEHIEQRIERMITTMQGKASLGEQGYLFALEDSETQKIVGVSAIEVAIGLDNPWYDFHVSTQVHASKDLGIYRSMKKLTLSNDHTGNSELCTLFLDPEYRKNKNGQLLSKSRFLFIAAFKDKFSEKLIAEMRGVNDAQGNTPFWDGLGKHFFNLSFDEVDYQTGIGNKSFIAELMPKHAFYVDFLSEQAQQVIGEVHPSTVPARKILESEGMRNEGYVDIFDAGPTVESQLNRVSSVKNSAIFHIKVAQPKDDAELFLISNTQLEKFRCTIASVSFDENNKAIITFETAQALQLQDEQRCRLVAVKAYYKTLQRL